MGSGTEVLRQPRERSIPSALTVLNWLGICYYLSATIAGAILEWFVIIPELSRAFGISTAKHRAIMLYGFVNAMGNYLLASSRDVHLKRSCGCISSDGRCVGRARRCRGIPFRAHYCKVCRQCILKRDHHCFIMGKCVGYHNQKHFIFCSAYTAVVSIYALVTSGMYTHQLLYKTEVWGAFTFVTLLPASIEAWFQGSVGVHELLLVLFLYVCLTGILGGLGLFAWQMYIVAMGVTTHEAMTRNKNKRTDTSVWENFADVLGRYWLLGVFLPLPLPQYGTGMYEGAEKLANCHSD